MKLLIAGYYTAPILALQQLFAQGFTNKDVALLTYGDDKRNEPLLAFAEATGIEVQTFAVKSDEALLWIRERGFDTLFSLYYRHLIPARVLEHFNGRAVNLHAGRLPDYAGCWSSAWSIINGEPYARYTYHYMTPEFDAGNILYWSHTRIEGEDTAFSLYHRLLHHAIGEFMPVLEKLGADGEPQKGERRYYGRELPHGGYIDPTWTDEQVERFIRAMIFPPFKGAMLRLSDGTEREILTMEDYARWREQTNAVS